MTTPKPLTFAVAGIAAVAIAFGAHAVGNSNSGGSSNAAAAPFARGAQPPANGQAPPGFGTPATGADAAKAKAAALAKYKGSVEMVAKLPDGSYEVHVITSSGEYHVAVSKGFQVTGAQQGGPGGPGGAGGAGGVPGGAPPSGSIPASPGSSATN
jgi:hypothetical protein